MIRVESSEEQIALEKFREATSDLNQDDVTLLRFLRAREHDLGKSEDMIRKALKWREETQVSKFLKWNPPSDVSEDMIFECTGKDYEGRPIFWLPLGRYNTRALVQQGLKTDVANFRYHLLETMVYHVNKSDADQLVAIFALEELTYWKIASMETMQILYSSLKDLQLHYPEILKKIFIINAPWFFPYIYNFIKPILTSRSAGKMEIYNSDKQKWFPELMKWMPKESLPAVYLD